MTEEMSTMSIADKSGDRKITWRRRLSRHKEDEKKEEPIASPPKQETAIVKEPEDERQARLAFEKALKEGKDIYNVQKPGDARTYKRMYAWDPSVKFISIEPRLSSGK